MRLAVTMDEATRDSPGWPSLPHRPLHVGSLVHYRYGGFAAADVQMRDRGVVPAIQDPDGALVPDERLPYFQAPAWAVDHLWRVLLPHRLSGR